MRHLWIATIGIATIVLLAATGCDRGDHPMDVGKTAPDFTVTDSQRTLSLHDFRGKVVVLNFWATWCPPCVEEMPSLIGMQRQLGDRVTVLAISLDQSEDAYRGFLRDHNVDLLSVRDAAQKSNTLYRTFQYPESYVIDRRGVIRRKFIGPVEWTRPEIVGYLKAL